MAIRCEHCGHVAPDADRFCGKCGAPLDAVAPPPGEGADDSWLSLAGAPASAGAPGSSGAPHDAPVAIAPAASQAQSAAPLPPLPAAPAAAMPAEDPVPPPLGPGVPLAEPEPPRRRTGRGLWIAVVAAGLVGALAIVVWTMRWAGDDRRIEIAAEGDDPVAPGSDARPLDDVYLSEEEVTLVTGGEARHRDYPTTEGSRIVATLPAGATVTGRWVRGRDPTTRWLKLAGGGYVWDGNLAQPGGEGSPIDIAIDNRRARFGPDIETYLERARAQQRAEQARIERLPEKERAAALEDIETRSSWVAVPARRWRGLTVTAVGQHYEGHGIVFREDEATVRRALAAAGITVDAQGSIPLANEEAITCGLAGTGQWPEARRWGATSLTCGV